MSTPWRVKACGRRGAIGVVAGALFPGAQAAAIGADPGPAIKGALDLLWNGLAADISACRKFFEFEQERLNYDSAGV